MATCLQATQSPPWGRHSGWEPFEVKIWTLFNNWSSVINHLKIFYKESHTRYFTKFLDFFVTVVFLTCLYKIEQQPKKKKGREEEMAPQSPTDPPSPRWGGSQVGWVMRRIRPSWGLDNYLMGIVCLFSCFLNLKYIFIFLYMFLFYFYILHWAPDYTTVTHTPPARHGWHLGWVYSMGAHPGTSSGHGPYTHTEKATSNVTLINGAIN